MAVVFVTGASGFVGRCLLPVLSDRGHTVRALSRETRPSVDDDGIHWVQGDLSSPEGYAAALEGADAVVHLAALTGKAPAVDYETVNVGGTKALMDAMSGASVRRFVFVSTIAVRYPEKKAYPYAQAKERAEDLVREMDLDWTIVRPTIVFGAGSPIFDSLAGLAKAAVTPLFGDGKTVLQPILHDDLAAAIADILEDVSTIGTDVDLGGPDRLSFDELMGKLRELHGRRAGPLLHLPLGLASFSLSLVEPLLLPLLPLTAGQLYAFRYDSIAQSSPFLEARISRFAGVDDMLEASKHDG